jgi:hypothetical protein
MKTIRPNGFVLTLVIVALGLMTVILLVLTTGTQTMLSQTDRMYVSAVENDLIASGTAWAAAQLSAGRLTASDQGTPLDAGVLSERPCQLTVRLINRADNRAIVDISTSCSKARWTLTHSRSYTIPIR